MIDAAKGVGILCVYLGHLVLYGSPTFRAIFNFHMPLFFFISGCFLRPRDELDARGYFMRLLTNIGIPFLFFSLIAALVALFNPPAEIPHGDDFPYWLVYCVSTWHGGPPFVTNVWFLICLAVTQTVAWLVWPWCGKSRWRLSALAISCIAISYAISLLDMKTKHLFPLMTSSVPMALVFYLAGYVCRDKIMTLSRLPVRVWMVTALFAAVAIELVFAVALCPWSPNLAVPEFPCMWTFLVASASGITAVLLMGRLLAIKPLMFLGRYSLYFFMMEVYGSSVARWLCRALGGRSLTDSPMTAAMSWGHVAMVMAVSLAAVTVMTFVARRPLSAIQAWAKAWRTVY